MQSKMNAVRISDLFLCCNVICFCVLDRTNEMPIAGSGLRECEQWPFAAVLCWLQIIMLSGRTNVMKRTCSWSCAMPS